MIKVTVPQNNVFPKSGHNPMQNRNWMNPLLKVINLENSGIFIMNNEHEIFCV